MKPIAKPRTTILQIFDSNDDEVHRIVTSKSAWRVNEIMKRVAKSPRFKGFSYRIDTVMFNSKYSNWSVVI